MTGDPTRRFSDRVENYVKYRPRYPPAFLACLRQACGLTPASVIADVGSGTGILSELFLKNGNSVLAVEPNDAMRQAAEARLSHYPNFTSINGPAEATTLPDRSVDFITAGQSFHWFEAQRAKAEFTRILRPGGYVVLVWNRQRVGATPFMSSYTALLERYALDYHSVKHTKESVDEDIALLFDGQMQVRSFPNEQRFDFEGLRGRLLSSSYAPLPDHPHYEPMMAELRRLFDIHEENGQIVFKYETHLYFSQVFP
ncbi:MAG TPA: class I SAM-dependent methyltransferase [Anaerolineae bacterium]